MSEDTEDRRGGLQSTDDEVLNAVNEHDHATAKNVAESLGFTREGARLRLVGLLDEGRLERERIGSTDVYTVVEEAE